MSNAVKIKDGTRSKPYAVRKKSEQLSLSSVELLSKLGLLSSSAVLVHNALSASLVNSLDSSSYSSFGISSLSSSSSVSLLDNSLEFRLNHLVLECLSSNNLYSLLSGFNIWHFKIPPKYST